MGWKKVNIELAADGMGGRTSWEFKLVETWSVTSQEETEWH